MNFSILKSTLLPLLALCAGLIEAQPVVVNQIAAKIGTQVITQSEVNSFAQTELIGESTLRQLFATSSDWSDYLIRRDELTASRSEEALRSLVKIRLAQTANEQISRTGGRRMAFHLTETELDRSVRSHEADLLKAHGNASELVRSLKEGNYALPPELSVPEYLRRYRADYRNRVLGAYRTQSYNAFLAAHFGDASQFYSQHFYLSTDMLRADMAKARQELGSSLVTRPKYNSFLSAARLSHLVATAQAVSADVLSLESIRKLSQQEYEKQMSVIKTKIVPMLSDTSALFAFEARVEALVEGVESVEALEDRRREKLSEFVEKGNYMSFVEALFADAAAILKANPSDRLSPEFRKAFSGAASQLALELAADPESLEDEISQSFVDSLRSHLAKVEAEMPALSQYEKKWVSIYQWTVAIKAKKALQEASAFVSVQLVGQDNTLVREDYKQRAYAKHFGSEELKLFGKWLRDYGHGAWVRIGARELAGDALEAWVRQ